MNWGALDINPDTFSGDSVCFPSRCRHVCRKSMHSSCGTACSTPQVNESKNEVFCKLTYHRHNHVDTSMRSNGSLTSSQPTSLGSSHCLANLLIPCQPRFSYISRIAMVRNVPLALSASSWFSSRPSGSPTQPLEKTQTCRMTKSSGASASNNGLSASAEYRS